MNRDLAGIGRRVNRQRFLVERDAPVANRMSVQVDAYIGLLLAIQNERGNAIRALRRGVASKCIAGGDVSACRRKIERERNRIDQGRRRTVVETAANKGAVAARKHRQMT